MRLNLNMKEKKNYLINKFKNKNNENIIDILRIY